VVGSGPGYDERPVFCRGSPDMIRLRSRSAEDTRAIGGVLAGVAGPGDLILLTGDLGAGKTVLAKGFGAALGITEPITSPTFTLVREYDSDPPLHHLDVYRLAGPGEVTDLDLPSLLDDGGITLIEWGEIVRGAVPTDHLTVELDLAPPDDDPDTRIVLVSAVGGRWAARMNHLSGVLAPWVVS